MKGCVFSVTSSLNIICFENVSEHLRSKLAFRDSRACVFCVCTCLLWRGRRGCDRVFEIVILLTHVCVSLHVCMHVCDSCLPLPLCTTANCQLTVAYTISPSSFFSHILYPRLLPSSVSPSHPISFFLSLPFLVSLFFFIFQSPFLPFL